MAPEVNPVASWTAGGTQGVYGDGWNRGGKVERGAVTFSEDYVCGAMQDEPRVIANVPHSREPPPLRCLLFVLDGLHGAVIIGSIPSLLCWGEGGKGKGYDRTPSRGEGGDEGDWTSTADG